MNERLREILSLLAVDQGFDDFNDHSKEYATQRWNELPQAARDFLLSLSSEDLENVCIGEARTGEDGDLVHLFNGQWQKLPSKVDYFLTEIWEYCE